MREVLKSAAKVLKEKVRSAAVAGTTSVESGHYHTYEVDGNGNGVTVVTSPEGVEHHYHVIEGFEVQSENDHRHELNG